MLRLKADLHAHAGDDPLDRLGYSAEMLIQGAAQLKFEVLAIACHTRVAYTLRLAQFAAERGVLLVPAVELLVEGKHVVVLNPNGQQAKATTFEELRTTGERSGLAYAPHPFYPARTCLHRALDENSDLFEAVEYSSAYFRGLNPNRRAVTAARRHAVPLVGTSDAHSLPYEPCTFSWVEVQEKSIRGVIDAVRAGRVEVETRPLPWHSMPRMAWLVMRDRLRAVADGLHWGG